MERLGLIGFCDEKAERSGDLISHERDRKTETSICNINNGDDDDNDNTDNIPNVIASKLTCLISVELRDLDSYRIKEINTRYEIPM